MAAVEEVTRELKDEDADDLCGRVCGILSRARLLKDNLTREQRMALKQLRELKKRRLLANIGNGTVVMRREDYNTKMRKKTGYHHTQTTGEGPSRYKREQSEL